MRCTGICVFCSLTHFLSCFHSYSVTFAIVSYSFVLVCSNESLLFFSPESTEQKGNTYYMCDFTLKIGCEIEYDFGVKETPIHDLLVFHSHCAQGSSFLRSIADASENTFFVVLFCNLLDQVVFLYSGLLLTVLVSAIYFCLYLLALKWLYQWLWVHVLHNWMDYRIQEKIRNRHR